MWVPTTIFFFQNRSNIRPDAFALHASIYRRSKGISREYLRREVFQRRRRRREPAGWMSFASRSATTDVLARRDADGRSGAGPAFFFCKESRMAKTIEAPSVFVPNPSRQDSKAATTNSVARSILETEVRQREAKTARLRALRMQMEAEAQPAEPKAAKPVKKRAAAKAKA
jgi:hypothetical protein